MSSSMPSFRIDVKENDETVKTQDRITIDAKHLDESISSEPCDVTMRSRRQRINIFFLDLRP